jgi:mutator protein MutT
MGEVAPVVRVLAAVIRREGRYLICLRPAHKRHGGLWEFPGGKLEPDEGLAEAADRELREELGLELVSLGATLFSYREPDSPFQIEFVPVDAAGDPLALEHTQVRWAAFRELEGLRLAPADRAFAATLR